MIILLSAASLSSSLPVRLSAVKLVKGVSRFHYTVFTGFTETHTARGGGVIIVITGYDLCVCVCVTHLKNQCHLCQWLREMA